MAQDVSTEVQESVVVDEELNIDHEFRPEQPIDHGGHKAGLRTRLRAKIIVPIAAMVVAAAAAGLYHYYAGWESTDDAQIDGYINPISSRIAGYVIHVYVDDNQFVKAGTLLAEIDPKDYKVALKSAEATLANDEATAAASQENVPLTSIDTSSQVMSAKADVDHARAGVSASEKKLASVQASLIEAEANHAKAQDDVERYKQLVEKQEISEQQYTQAVQTAKAAAAAVDAARSSVQGTSDQVTQAKAKLQQALAQLRTARTGPQQVRIERSRALASEARVQKSQAAVEYARLNLSYTRIFAPVDGVVAKRSAQAGEYVTPGEQLMAIVPLDDIWVTANFKETQLKQMHVGLPVEIYVDAFGRNYTGHVESLAGGTGAVFSLLPPENATGNYVKVVQRLPVRVRFDKGQDPDHLLRPGMSVEPKVKVN
jgi:membrane fusion protein, multidrug efflux system